MIDNEKPQEVLAVEMTVNRRFWKRHRTAILAAIGYALTSQCEEPCLGPQVITPLDVNGSERKVS